MTNRKGSAPEPAPEGTARPPRKLSGKALTPEAKRALAEAEQRRRGREAEAEAGGPQPKEVGGVDGPDPVRYGDWENKGRASDF